ncbi:unnamed protein product [Aphanomyces euteiches]
MRSEYELVRRMGAPDDQTNVSLYTHTPSQDLVVIKKIPTTIDKMDENKEMHINRVLQKHKHDAIVEMRDAFMEDQELCLVFEYCSGGDLLASLQNAKSWAEDDVIPIFQQVASAVAHLHSLEIAHCDISLENVLVTSDHQVKLCDFGLALIDKCTRFSGVGKLYYMSPEMFMRRPYNAQASDRWALGVLLFMLLTGRPIFEQATMKDPNFKLFFEAQAVDASSGVKAVLAASNTTLSDDAVDLLTQLLRPAPKDRLSMDLVLSHAFLKTRPRSVSTPVMCLSSSFPLAHLPLAYFKSITTM